MNEEILLALLLKHMEDRFASLPKPVDGVDGPRGLRGHDGRSFVFSEHEDTIRDWVKEFSLKFSDLSDSEKEEFKGPRGDKGDNGRSFIFEENKERIIEIVSEEINKISSDLRLKFSDLTIEEKEEIRGSAGKDGDDGKDFSFEENKEQIIEVVGQEVGKLDLKLKFSDLSDSEKEELKGPRGLRGRDGLAGKSFVFEEHEEFFQGLKPKFSDFTDEEKEQLRLKFADLTDEQKSSLKLRFSDLNEEDLAALRGPRGVRGQRGREGLKGEKGKDGLNGKNGLNGIRGLPGIGVRGLTGPEGKAGLNGQDAPYVTDIEIDQKKTNFRFIFSFSDGSELVTNYVNNPKNKTEVYIAGGGGGSGGSGDGEKGDPGDSAYQVAVDNGFVGTEAEWLASLVGPQGDDGMDGADGADGLDGADGADGLDGADGADGLDGADGAAATISIGTVETLEPDEDAYVTNVGTTSAAILNFGIPRGEDGTGGGSSSDVRTYDCPTEVFEGAAVRLTKTDPVELTMDMWTSLAILPTLVSYTYTIVAVLGLADSRDHANIHGVVEEKPTTTSCKVRVNGVSKNIYFGLDVETEYYLSDEFPGVLVPYDQRPTDGGSVVVRIGRAVEEDRLCFSRGELNVI